MDFVELGGLRHSLGDLPGMHPRCGATRTMHCLLLLRAERDGLVPVVDRLAELPQAIISFISTVRVAVTEKLSGQNRPAILFVLPLSMCE